MTKLHFCMILHQCAEYLDCSCIDFAELTKAYSPGYLFHPKLHFPENVDHYDAHPYRYCLLLSTSPNSTFNNPFIYQGNWLAFWVYFAWIWIINVSGVLFKALSLFRFYMQVKCSHPTKSPLCSAGMSANAWFSCCNYQEDHTQQNWLQTHTISTKLVGLILPPLAGFSQHLPTHGLHLLR